MRGILIVSCLTNSPRYSEDISVICAFDKTISELTLEIGAELANKLYSVRDANPEVWTSDLEKYIDTALRTPGKNLKLLPSMSRKIGERKFIVNQISIFKF